MCKQTSQSTTSTSNLKISVEHLGVELGDKLKFDIQVSLMCKKAAK